MQWPPKYKRIILGGGDESAAHSSGKESLKMGDVAIPPREESAPPAEGDLPLEH